MHPGVTNFLTYHRLIKAIPREWKQKLQMLRLADPTCTGWQATRQLTKTSKWVYTDLLAKSKVENPARIMWGIELNEQLGEEEWSKLYLYIAKITLSTKLRFYQYRLQNKKVTTNIQRSKWDADVTPQCTFCNNALETMYHISWECIHVQRIWKALER